MYSLLIMYAAINITIASATISLFLFRSDPDLFASILLVSSLFGVKGYKGESV